MKVIVDLENITRVIKNKGKCLCNIKLDCPCPAYTKFKKCLCGVFLDE